MAEKLTATQKWLKLLDEIASDGSDFSPYEQRLRIARKVTPGYFMVAVAALRSQQVHVSPEAEEKAAKSLNISDTNRKWAAQAMQGYLRGEIFDSPQFGVTLTLNAAEEASSHNPEAIDKFTAVIMQHVELEPVLELVPEPVALQEQAQVVAA